MSEQNTTEIERRCAYCGASISQSMGFILARDQMAFAAGARIIPRELCGKCIFAWSVKRANVEEGIVDTTEEEREVFIAALPPPRPLPERAHE